MSLYTFVPKPNQTWHNQHTPELEEKIANVLVTPS